MASRWGVLAWIALAICLALVPGCRRRSRTQAAAVRAIPGHRALLRDARQALDCENLSLTAVDVRVAQVLGCGQRSDFASDQSSGHWAELRSVSSRAETDLGCASTALVVTHPASRVSAVTGCGRRARYDLVCEDLGCEWRMTAHAGAWGPLARRTSAAPPDDAWPEPDAPLTSDTQAYETDTQWLGGSEVELAIPEPPATPAPADVVTARIGSVSTALHGCVAGALVVRAAWSIEGTVSFSLVPPLAGTSAETCVRAHLCAPRVVPAGAGSVDIAVP